MDAPEVCYRIREIYLLILNENKVELFFQYEDELDQLYDALKGEARGDVQLTDPLRLLYEELHQLNQQVQNLIQGKQALNKKMKDISYDSYNYLGDAYFVDRKW